MGHLRDNIFVLDTRMSDPVGHLLGYLILAFNYSEGNIIILYICISFKWSVPRIWSVCPAATSLHSVYDKVDKIYCVSWIFLKEM